MERQRGKVVVAIAALALSGGALAQAGKVTIKLNLGTPAGHPYNVGAEAFKRVVEADTGGAVAVEIFPSAQLGGETESAKNVQLGTLEATIVSTSNLSSFLERLNVLSVPYVFKKIACPFSVDDGPAGQQFFVTLLKDARLH